MRRVPVRFSYHLGVPFYGFSNPRLVGSWDADGNPAEVWSETPMDVIRGHDGCPVFFKEVDFPEAHLGKPFRWGVKVDGPAGPDLWAIALEVHDHRSKDRTRGFALREHGAGGAPGPEGDTGIQHERYYLTHCRRLGANRYYVPGSTAINARFAVWAPNARSVALVIGDPKRGYIGDDGSGIRGRYPMFRTKSSPWSGVWETRVDRDDDVPDGFDSCRQPTGFTADETLPVAPRLDDYGTFRLVPYMFEIEKDDGTVAYRTDIYSRHQIGSGRRNSKDPEEPTLPAWDGTAQDLDGTVSCSVVVDPARVATAPPGGDAEGRFPWPPKEWIDDATFWAGEHDPERPLPSRIDDLVIYELHVGALGYGRCPQGTLEEAVALLDDHLVPLGVNCVELLPISEHRSSSRWGYSTSHFCAIETSIGGREWLKHFVKACHQRGIAVLMDVVYNHYHHVAERAQALYDSNAVEKDIYYWYEGLPTEHPTPQGGYLDNFSTGAAPRYWEEFVRQLFISSAAAYLVEFHVDGFRVDQTTSIREYNKLAYEGGRAVPEANAFGTKLLREWTTTMRLLKPGVFLTAEDHSDRHPSPVTAPVEHGGLGFDATWYSDFYHHLIGDTKPYDHRFAKLLVYAARYPDQPLRMDFFAGALRATPKNTVVYQESHDEAGNSENGTSMRTIKAAVNGAALEGETIQWAEARSRWAAAVTLLSGGTPMFFMGEEVGAAKPYRYADYIALGPESDPREDLSGLRKEATGGRMFRYFQDLIALRLGRRALRERHLEVLHVNNEARVLAFRRWCDDDGVFVLCNLADRPHDAYRIEHHSLWGHRYRELLCSDATVYGGWGDGNGGFVDAHPGSLSVCLPRCSVIVLGRAS